MSTSLRNSFQWKLFRELRLPSYRMPFVCRKNETISYACLNVIRTWDWRTNQEHLQFFDTKCITALSEFNREDLIIGDEQGRILVESHSSWIPTNTFHSPINEILMIGPNHVIVTFENKHASLVDIKNGRVLQKFASDVKVCRFRENFFAKLNCNSVEVYDVQALTAPKYQCSLDKPFSAIRAEKERFLMLQYIGNKSITIKIWHPEQNKSLQVGLRKSCYIDSFKHLILIDFETFIAPRAEKEGNYLERYSYNKKTEKWNVIRGKVDNSYPVMSMIGLGHCVVYATQATPSYIHIFNKNCNPLFSSRTFTDQGSVAPERLIALSNGSFAIKLSHCIRIIARDAPSEYKRRLFVGEGDFSYTEALIQKKQFIGLPKAITATAPTAEPTNRSVKARIDRLKTEGVDIRFGIDAQKIDEQFANQRFKRIHWVCPYGNSPTGMKSETFIPMIRNFFSACRKIQCKGDRIHVVLMQEKQNFHWKIRQIETPIFLASASNGYHLIKKRWFGTIRYPWYKHSISSKEPDGNDENEMREFIFEKIVFKKKYAIKKAYQVESYEGSGDYYFACSTDYDSSDYEESFNDDMNYETSHSRTRLARIAIQP